MTDPQSDTDDSVEVEETSTGSFGDAAAEMANETEIEGGEVPPLADCESCILSHRELVADPGECLDPNQLPEVNQDNPRPGLGGEGGQPIASGGAFFK